VAVSGVAPVVKARAVRGAVTSNGIGLAGKGAAGDLGGHLGEQGVGRRLIDPTTPLGSFGVAVDKCLGSA
jgi:hypothetical protein